MKTLKFRKELAELILAGEKTSTWRIFDDKDLQTGDECMFVVAETEEIFAHAVLGEIKERKFGEMTAEDMDGHEKYASTAEMLAAFSGYYNQPITIETLVKIIKFKTT
ncbi:MAG: ASCH domain-containing protein [Candidatus Moranbacteria bacterium]|nr:ASCH domain-containing protein [Candidatus Moranbacteria bacterium]